MVHGNLTESGVCGNPMGKRMVYVISDVPAKGPALTYPQSLDISSYSTSRGALDISKFRHTGQKEKEGFLQIGMKERSSTKSNLSSKDPITVNVFKDRGGRPDPDYVE